ncbi:AMP-binding protein [Cryptosporangium aurantiacum]|uniref:Crotonobetaine/carnitine-CoA ligase n=1 Tax=Cryptosporangium aurantiacum TaxID=134849 RepID=A0A1M7R4E9_9ACTN|nr:AMP-binding protein [Cryptosporangium aurantiacum]SHN40080.1 crotonobetaine/carnitine-CoA ligase [Cryptosporangium aurantiacum]
MSTPVPIVVTELVRYFAARVPDNLCVTFGGDEKWTWADAEIETYRAANALHGLGVRRGDRIGIMMPNSADWLRAWWGLVSLGAVMVPINPALRGTTLEHVVRDAELRRVIGPVELEPRFAEIGGLATVIDSSVLATGSADPVVLDPPPAPWDLHTINYTSGTTGPAKGVLTTYRHSFAAALHNDWRATVDDVLLTTSPLFHCGGQVISMGAWIGGGCVALRDSFRASKFLDVVRESGATMTLLVGTMAAVLDAMPEKPDDADNPLRLVMAVPMVADSAAFARRFGLSEMVAAFGMTEVGTGMTVRGPHIDRPGTAGRVRPGAELRLVDEHDEEVPVGTPGELVLRTDDPWEITYGYLNLHEATARAWRNGWFHTGDQFVMDADGYLYFSDRIKDSLRRRGENISSFEVEREVAAYPAVEEVACVAASDGYGGDEVKVFVVPRAGEDLDPEALIHFLVPRMPYHMVPRFVEVVDELPKTPTMKVRKAELRERGNSPGTWDREVAGILLTRESAVVGEPAAREPI